MNFLGRKVKRNDKRVARTVKDLVKEGYLFVHKKGETVSLNPSRANDTVQYVNHQRSML